MARILVADDETDVLWLVTLTLELEGHEVITASNGADAVRRATEEAPDVILLDVMMASLDGLTALRHLREQPQTRATPVVLLSGKAQQTDIDSGMDAGATAYVTKPFEPDDLLAVVERVRGFDDAGNPITPPANTHPT